MAKTEVLLSRMGSYNHASGGRKVVSVRGFCAFCKSSSPILVTVLFLFKSYVYNKVFGNKISIVLGPIRAGRRGT